MGRQRRNPSLIKFFHRTARDIVHLIMTQITTMSIVIYIVLYYVITPFYMIYNINIYSMNRIFKYFKMWPEGHDSF
jgi:hypothetical protein